jgi:hypothetical protein
MMKKRKKGKKNKSMLISIFQTSYCWQLLLQDPTIGIVSMREEKM